MSTSTDLKRDCEATQIPSGATVSLPAGLAVDITQTLGGAYTIHARGGLFNGPVTPDVTTEAYRLNGVRQTQTLLYSPSYTQPLVPTPSTIAVATTRQFAPNLAGDSGDCKHRVLLRRNSFVN